MKLFTTITAAVALLASVVNAGIKLDVKSKSAVDRAAKLGSQWLGYHYQSWNDGAWDQNIIQWHESGMYWQTYLQYRRYFADPQYDNFIASQLIIATFYDLGDFLDTNRGAEATFQGKWNDDIAWWGLAAIAGAEVYGPDAKINPNGANGEKGSNWLSVANKTLFNMMEQYDTTTCGGGIYWSRDRRSKSKNYKSSISNGQAILLAAKLYQFTKNKAYVDIADNIYKWMKQYVMMDDYLIIDGIDALRQGSDTSCGDTTYNPWSYQHGVLIPAMATFYNVTGDESYLTEAHKHFESSVKWFVNKNNVIHEFICEEHPEAKCKDPNGFTWALFRGYAALYTITPDNKIKERIASIIEATAADNANQCPGSDNDWNCIRQLNPVPPQYTFDNGTNPRDQIETMEILTALAIVRGNEPKSSAEVPVAPAAPAAKKPSGAVAARGGLVGAVGVAMVA
ncbi:hydrolase 76 protein, partial [Phlyctochytrium planicorne]